MPALRGTLLHEILNLPIFWLNMWQEESPSIPPQQIAYGRHSRQYFLLFHPRVESVRRSAAIIYIHGGGWRFGSPEAFQPHARVFTEAGFPAVFPSFRRIPFYGFDDMREDLNLLLRRLRLLWEEEQWAGRRLIVGGMSSGGHLAAHLALNHEALSDCGWAPSDIDTLFCCGAPLDLNRMPMTPVVRSMAGPRGSKSYHRANPVGLIEAEYPPPPTLLIHGARDGLVPIDSCRGFAERIRELPDVPFHFYIIPDGTHLDAASWGHTENEVRREILQWIGGLAVGR